MNGERQIEEFINRPCKETMMQFVKALFSAKPSSRKRARRMGHSCNMIRWRTIRCDMKNKRSPFDSCASCPFNVQQRHNHSTLHTTGLYNECFFVIRFQEAYRGHTGISNNDFNQHIWPKVLMPDIGILLLGAVKIKHMLDIKREEKAMTPKPKHHYP